MATSEKKKMKEREEGKRRKLQAQNLLSRDPQSTASDATAAAAAAAAFAAAAVAVDWKSSAKAAAFAWTEERLLKRDQSRTQWNT